MEIRQIGSIVEALGAELVETHISWVLLCETDVYKIKKPVKFSFLDFSTLEQRKFYCGEEVRLNRRLSPDVYLGVVPVFESGGSVSLGGSGTVVDYAVRMRRLDGTRMMDRLLANGGIGEEDVRGLASAVAAFHAKAERAGDGFGSPKLVGEQIADLGNHRATIEKACGLGKWVDGILSRSALFIRKNRIMMEGRAGDGMVRECHGDLHSRNVFFQDGIKIVDCIEFSRDFRCIDVASDVAFMAMDLDYAGREDLSRAFMEEYLSRTGDSGLEALLPLYKCYRANVRAKIAAIEWEMNGKEEERQRIDRYTLLAAKYSKVL
jgi:aminoglycoside phosphotransferase family enzyme